jgi:hypothetical protein
MARRTFNVVDVTEILVHWHAGRSKSALADSLGLDRKTVRKYLAPAEESGIVPGDQARSQAEWKELVAGWFPGLADAKVRQVSWPQIEPHRDYIVEALGEGVTKATIHQRLRDERGLTASCASLKRTHSGDVRRKPLLDRCLTWRQLRRLEARTVGGRRFHVVVTTEQAPHRLRRRRWLLWDLENCAAARGFAPLMLADMLETVGPVDVVVAAGQAMVVRRYRQELAGWPIFWLPVCPGPDYADIAMLDLVGDAGLSEVVVASDDWRFALLAHRGFRLTVVTRCSEKVSNALARAAAERRCWSSHG